MAQAPIETPLAVRRHPARGALLLLALVLVAFSSALVNAWIWDDDAHVTHNPVLRSGAGLASIWADRTATPQYYPLVHTTFWLEYRLWGMQPFGFHLDNVLLHALGVVCLWRFLVRLELPGAWYAAALFAVHPVTVESVAWVTERKNVLSFALALAAAVTWWDWSHRGGAWRAGLSWLCYAGALASKTVVASLPAVLVVLVWWKGRRLGARAWLSLAAMFVVGAWLGGLTALAERQHVGAEGTRWALDTGERVIVAGRALAFYAGKLVLPIGLVFNYPRWQIDAASPAQWIAPVALAALFVVLFSLRHRIGRGPCAAVAIYAGVLFPALGFLNVYPHRYSFVADHFQYHAAPALLALFTAAAVGFAGISRGRHALPRALPAATAGLLLALLAGSTWSYCRAYRDAGTLWRHVVQHNPGSYLAFNNLAKLEAAGGRTEAAIRLFERALAIDPDLAEAANNLGQLHLNRGRLDEAEPLLRRAAALEPGLPQPWANLGHLERLKGNRAAAIEHYERAQSLARASPQTEVSAWLGILLAREGSTARALDALRVGLADPRLGVDVALAEIWIRATHDEANFRSGERALELARGLFREARAPRVETLDAIAAAYAEAGRFDDAVSSARQARDLARREGREALAFEIAHRLALYEAHRPCRTPYGTP